MAEARASPLEQAMDLHTGSAAAAAVTVAATVGNGGGGGGGGGGGPSEDNSSSTGSNEALSLEVLELQCPATPQLHFKIPDPTSSESEDNDEPQSDSLLPAGTAAIGDGLGRSASPPPNCAICLGRCKNKCFTDSCMHQFCFKCLCEWSKVKPECPLCKQAFKSIIHNVKSIDVFEEYHVQPPTVQIPQRPMLNYSHMHYMNVSRNNLEIQLGEWDQPRPGGRLPYRSERYLMRNASADNVLNPFDHRSELLELYRQEHPQGTPISSTTMSHLWRRYVYDRNLCPMPLCDIMGRFRDCSPRFYRDNPAQVDRLIAWVHRDLTCLLRNTTHDVMAVLERVKDSLFCFNILSPTFRRRLQPCLGAHTQHFIQELYNFARSPYDLIGYDRVVQYLPQNHASLVIEFSSSSEDEAGSANASEASTARPHRSRHQRTHNPAHDYRLQSRHVAGSGAGSVAVSGSGSGSGSVSVSASVAVSGSGSGDAASEMLTFSVSTTSEGAEAPGVSLGVASLASHNLQSTAINLTTRNRNASSHHAGQDAADYLVIELDDSEVVDVTGDGLLPSAHMHMHSRSHSRASTSSNSNSNLASDLQAATSHSTAVASAAVASTTVADPPPTENIELSSSSSDECEFVLERKPPHLRTPELVSLHSDTDSDVIFIEEVKLDEESPHSGAPHTASTMTTRRSERTKRRSSEHNARQPKAELEQFNVGASTSTGLRSSARLRRQASSSQSHAGPSEIEVWNSRLSRSRRNSSRRSRATRTRTRTRSTRPGRGKRLRSHSSSKEDEDANDEHEHEDGDGDRDEDESSSDSDSESSSSNDSDNSTSSSSSGTASASGSVSPPAQRSRSSTKHKMRPLDRVFRKRKPSSASSSQQQQQQQQQRHAKALKRKLEQVERHRMAKRSKSSTAEPEVALDRHQEREGEGEAAEQRDSSVDDSDVENLQALKRRIEQQRTEAAVVVVASSTDAPDSATALVKAESVLKAEPEQQEEEEEAEGSDTASSYLFANAQRLPSPGENVSIGYELLYPTAGDLSMCNNSLGMDRLNASDNVANASPSMMPADAFVVAQLAEDAAAGAGARARDAASPHSSSSNSSVSSGSSSSAASSVRECDDEDRDVHARDAEHGGEGNADGDGDGDASSCSSTSASASGSVDRSMSLDDALFAPSISRPSYNSLAELDNYLFGLEEDAQELHDAALSMIASLDTERRSESYQGHLSMDERLAESEENRSNHEGAAPDGESDNDSEHERDDDDDDVDADADDDHNGSFSATLTTSNVEHI